MNENPYTKIKSETDKLSINIKINQKHDRDFVVTDPIAPFLLPEVYQFTEINATSHKTI